MVIISANNINKSYGISSILSDVSFHIDKGDRVGIVGANGAGKSTLLNIIAGKTKCDSGDIFISGNSQIGYLTQSSSFALGVTVYDAMLSIFDDLVSMEKRLSDLSHNIAELSGKGEDAGALLREFDELSETFDRRNGYSYKSEITGILNSLAFPPSFFNKNAGELSGGEKTRLALAALLLRKPDILLLDEPTNHLDIGTMNWLEQYLKGYNGTIVLISHDRYFLDRTITRVFEIDNHRLSAYEGNYSVYTEKKRMRVEAELRAYEKQQTEIKRQEDMIRKYKERGTEKLAKRAKSREKMLGHIEVIDRPAAEPGKIKIKFKNSAKSGNDVLEGFELSKVYGAASTKRVLFENVSYDIKRDEKICLVGANGIGKTTLLKIILGEIEPSSGRLKVGHNVEFAYYDQEQRLLDNSETVLGELHNSYRLYDATELRGLLGRFLFKNDDVFKKVGDLSGGEKARLALLKLMLSGANVLIMDEPTNHLDISSKEVFEDALLDFPGTVIIVSHDRYLLNKVPDRILELKLDGLTNFPGNYDYYIEKKKSLESAKKYLDNLGKSASIPTDIKSLGDEVSVKASSKEDRMRNKEAEADRRKAERDKANAEAEIAALEEKISSLEAEMCKEEYFTDHNKLAEINEQLNNAKDELESIYDAWLTLSD